MNSKNLDFLQSALKYLGFGENTPLNEELKTQIEAGLAEFQLYTEECFDDYSRIEVKLYFVRSTRDDMYFFNKYDALLHYPDEPENDRAQTIYLNQHSRGFTFKETFNLLEGRAVYRELTGFDKEKFYAWSQLNFDEKDLHGNYKFKRYYERYAYDLEKALHTYPILELQNDKLKEHMIRALQRGNAHPVTFVMGKKADKYLIQADPKSRLLTFCSQATRAAHRLAARQKTLGMEGQILPAPDKAKGGASEEDKEPTPMEIETVGIPAEINFPAEVPEPAEEEEEAEVGEPVGSAGRIANVSGNVPANVISKVPVKVGSQASTRKRAYK